MRHGIALSKKMSPKTSEEVDSMQKIPYTSVVGSLMYAMLCTRPNICYAVGIVSRYQLNPDWNIGNQLSIFLSIFGEQETIC